MGDFNEVLKIGEKFWGKTIAGRKTFLNDFFQAVGVVNLGWVGKRFTWENRQEGNAFIKERLDRFIANKDWLEIFEEAMVEHLNSEASDYAPILLSTDGGEVRTGMRPFQFLEMWITNMSSHNVVQRAWDLQVRGGMETHKVLRRLQATAKALREWNRNHFGYTQERIKMLEHELELVQFGEGENLRHQAQIEEDLRNQRARQESIMRQKS